MTAYYTPSYEVVPIYCPVCKGCLGKKRISTVVSFHCEECKATYWYGPNETLPCKATLDKDKEKGCNCGRCGN